MYSWCTHPEKNSAVLGARRGSPHPYRPPVESRSRVLVEPSEVSHDIGQRVEGIDNSFMAASAMMTDTNDPVLKR